MGTMNAGAARDASPFPPAWLPFARLKHSALGLLSTGTLFASFFFFSHPSFSQFVLPMVSLRGSPNRAQAVCWHLWVGPGSLTESRLLVKSAPVPVVLDLVTGSWETCW